MDKNWVTTHHGGCDGRKYVRKSLEAPFPSGAKTCQTSPPSWNLVGYSYQARMGISSVLCKFFWFSCSFCQGVPKFLAPTIFWFVNLQKLALVRPFGRELWKNWLDFWNLQENPRAERCPYFLLWCQLQGVNLV